MEAGHRTRPEVVNRLREFLQTKLECDGADRTKALLWRCAAEGRGVGPFGVLSVAEVREAVDEFDRLEERTSWPRDSGKPGVQAIGDASTTSSCDRGDRGHRGRQGRQGRQSEVRSAHSHREAWPATGPNGRYHWPSSSDSGVIARPWGPEQRRRYKEQAEVRKPDMHSHIAGCLPRSKLASEMQARPAVVEELANYLRAQPKSRRESAKLALRNAVRNGWRIAGISELADLEVEEAILLSLEPAESSEKDAESSACSTSHQRGPTALRALTDHSWVGPDSARAGVNAVETAPREGPGSWSRVVATLREESRHSPTGASRTIVAAHDTEQDQSRPCVDDSDGVNGRLEREELIPSKVADASAVRSSEMLADTEVHASHDLSMSAAADAKGTSNDQVLAWDVLPTKWRQAWADFDAMDDDLTEIDAVEPVMPRAATRDESPTRYFCIASDSEGADTQATLSLARAKVAEFGEEQLVTDDAVEKQGVVNASTRQDEPSHVGSPSWKPSNWTTNSGFRPYTYQGDSLAIVQATPRNDTWPCWKQSAWLSYTDSDSAGSQDGDLASHTIWRSASWSHPKCSDTSSWRSEVPWFSTRDSQSGACLALATSPTSTCYSRNWTGDTARGSSQQMTSWNSPSTDCKQWSGTSRVWRADAWSSSPEVANEKALPASWSSSYRNWGSGPSWWSGSSAGLPEWRCSQESDDCRTDIAIT